MNEIISASIVKRSLQIIINNETLNFDDCWLRDHCRCKECYHADTYQRAKHVLEIPDDEIKACEVSCNKLKIAWNDGHFSEFDIEFLKKYNYSSWSKGNRLKPILWKGNEMASKISRVHVGDFLNSIDGARSVFQSLLDYGVALIDEVEPSTQATESVCKALGGVQRTLFGDMWEFTTKADHADTAYTNLPLASHHDNTYFTEAAGLQILHCIEHTNGSGGETTLVDGFFGATRLKEEHPKDFDFLTQFEQEAEYIEDNHHHKYSAPIINLDHRTGQMKQIRFNVYDRSPTVFENSEQCRTYYRSLKNLAKYYEDVQNQWRFKLTPGLVMVMDNFRVLHGRTAFTGRRVLCGSYVSRSDWLDRARVLKLID